MQKYADVVLDRKGNVVPNASVRVKTSTAEDAVLYAANGTSPISNPLTTDNLGRFAFYAENGRYNLQVYIGSALFTVSNDILLEDPQDETPETIKNGLIKDSALENVTIDGEPAVNKTVTDALDERIDEIESTGPGGLAGRVAALEQFDEDLSDPTDPIKGTAMLGRGTVNIELISDLETVPRSAGARAHVKASVGGWSAASVYLGPRGGGDYYWDATSTQTHDKATVYKPADVVGAGRWLREITTEILASWFEVIPDGRDNGAAIDAMLAYASLTNPYKALPMVFEPGEYITSHNHRISPHLCLKSKGNVNIQFTGTGTLFWVSWSSTTDPIPDFISPTGQNALASHNIFDGSEGTFWLTGSGAAGSQVAIEYGLRVSPVATFKYHVAWGISYGLFIDKFQHAWKFNTKEVYILRHIACSASNCGTIITDDNGTQVNSGEQINWESCSFHNSERVAEFNIAFSHAFNKCSFDYMTGDACFLYNKGYHVLRITDCHGEAWGAQDKPFVKTIPGGAAINVHVSIKGMFVYPRDRKQTVMFAGPMKLRFNDNSINTVRFGATAGTYPGYNHYLCDDLVTVVSSRGNAFIEQAQAMSKNSSANTNPRFEIDAVGTLANNAAPDAITGWTHPSAGGSAAVDISNTHVNLGTKSMRVIVPGAGAFTTMTTKKFIARPGAFCSFTFTLYTDGVQTVNATGTWTFFDNQGVTLGTAVGSGSQTTQAGVWTTYRADMNAVAPSGTATATFAMALGNMAADVWVGDANVMVS